MLRTNGTTTVSSSTAVNLNLADNPFYREFTDTVELTDAARALLAMQGSGWVRDLREAISLDGAGGDVLDVAVGSYASATTRDAQRQQIDGLLRDWAGSTGRLTASGTGSDWTREVTATLVSTTARSYTYRYQIEEPTGGPTSGPVSGLVVRVAFQSASYYTNTSDGKVFTAAAEEVTRRIAVLEVFNGQRSIDFTQTISFSSAGGQSSGGAVNCNAGMARRECRRLPELQSLTVACKKGTSQLVVWR